MLDAANMDLTRVIANGGSRAQDGAKQAMAKRGSRSRQGVVYHGKIRPWLWAQRGNLQVKQADPMLPAVVWIGAVLWQFGCVTAVDMAAAIEEAAADHSPLVGKRAPGFSLPDQDDRPFTLAQWRGRWLVLYFYPRDDTAGCKCQATEFTELMDKFDRLHTTVVGVSPDTTKSHRLFMQKHRIKITLLSDPDAVVAKMYGAWQQMGQSDDRVGRFIRSTVLINPEGRIVHHWPEVIPRGHAERVRRILKTLAKNQ